jgi:hypothetical protein
MYLEDVAKNKGHNSFKEWHIFYKQEISVGPHKNLIKWVIVIKEAKSESQRSPVIYCSYPTGKWQNQASNSGWSVLQQEDNAIEHEKTSCKLPRRSPNITYI